MRTPLLAAVAVAAAALLCATSASAATAAAVNPAAVLADPARPAADKAQDAQRKAADVLAFVALHPGDKVADIYPGGGFYTRVFSKAVGPTGKVYGVFGKVSENAAKLAQDPAFTNIAVVAGQPWGQWKPAEPLDAIFNSQFYHDLYNPQYGDAGGEAAVPAINKAFFDALKPGGEYIVIDHASTAGKGIADFNTLHRIDEEAAIKAITAAGFVLESRSQILRNPADPRTANVFDPAIRGKTDQFVLKFRKPAR
jgi:predicted methyltransferase